MIDFFVPLQRTLDTPLHIAVSMAGGSTDMMRLLLDRGADANKANAVRCSSSLLVSAPLPPRLRLSHAFAEAPTTA